MKQDSTVKLTSGMIKKKKKININRWGSSLLQEVVQPNNAEGL